MRKSSTWIMSLKPLALLIMKNQENRRKGRILLYWQEKIELLCQDQVNGLRTPPLVSSARCSDFAVVGLWFPRSVALRGSGRASAF